MGCMTIRKNFALQHGTEIQGNAPSSGDGASVESRLNLMTGQREPYTAPQPSARQSTGGGLSGDAHGDLAGYRAKQAHYGAVHSDGGAGGIGVGQPCDFHTTGSIPADSNNQPETTTGGTDHLVTCEAGGDADWQESQGFGGKPIGL